MALEYIPAIGHKASTYLPTYAPAKPKPKLGIRASYSSKKRESRSTRACAMDWFGFPDNTGAEPLSMARRASWREARAADSSKLQWDLRADGALIESHAEQRVGRYGR